MKRVLLLVGLGAGLLVAAPAPAKTVTVDISKLGFVPAAVTVQVGDSVTWTNKDTATHQVVCATCPFTSPPIAAGLTFTYTFTKVGKFNVVDPLNRNKKGTVTVAAAPASASVAATRPVTYGTATTISGSISTGEANQKVDILAQPCGETVAKAVATATTTAGGAFTWQTQPTLLTSYQVRFKPATGPQVTSTAIPVSVRPVVGLGKSGRGRFKVRVLAAQSFVGKAVAFQRLTVRKRWTTVKTVFLGTRAAAAAPLAGTTVSSAAFTVRIKRGLRVRAVLPAGQAAPCYAGAQSRTILS